MHPTARSNAKLFFDTYVSHIGAPKLLDIGSQDVNGSLRDETPPAVEYFGVDFEPGKGVDVVLTDPYQLPFDAESFDVVVTSSCFEHSEMFWLTFLEALRVLKPHGLLYVNAPSNGEFHRYPVDCWRFYPDAGRAFVSWARHEGVNAALLEFYVCRQRDDLWNDFVAVFVKDAPSSHRYPARIVDSFEDFENGFVDRSPETLHLASNPEDQRTAIELKKEVERIQTELAAMRGLLAEKSATIAAQEAALAEQEATLAEKEATLAAQEAALAAQAAALAAQAAALAAQEAALAEKEALLVGQSERITILSEDLERLTSYAREADRVIAYVSQKYTSLRHKKVFQRIRYATMLAFKGRPIRSSQYAVVRNSVFFDKNYYLGENPDVRASRMDPVVHYLAHGAKEGRDPSPIFSEEGYRSGYSDVAKSGLSAVEHYETVGRKEGRPLCSRRDLG